MFPSSLGLLLDCGMDHTIPINLILHFKIIFWLNALELEETKIQIQDN
jgi:hypothetical protein